jgi:hypothetical protein
MSYYTILFAPLMVLLPAAGAIDPKPDLTGDAIGAPSERTAVENAAPAEAYAPPQVAPAADFPEGSPFRMVVESFREQAANQVRIEQQVTIRVSPRPQPARPNMLMDLPGREVGPRFLERKMGKCLKVSRIAGVQPNGGSQLLLFMRDQRIVSAELERACRARDFYSGFYLSRSTDGRLCVDRDTLLSRSGANCKLTRIRQLVESGD